MTETLLWVALVCAVCVAVGLPSRRFLQRHSQSQAAQRRYRRIYEARIRELVGGSAPNNPERLSPWMHVEFDGSAVRLSATWYGRNAFLGGLQLVDRQLISQIYFTGDGGNVPPEIEGAPSAIEAELGDLAAEMRRVGIDSVSSGSSDPEVPHIIRFRFNDVSDLPQLFEQYAPLVRRLAELEQN